MSGLRGRSAVAADHRSALPRVPGVPWWGAALLAIGLTAIGVAFDAGSGTNELGAVFTVCFVLGCVAAVLAVRQSGVFTAVIQPPLILFVAVPFAYFVFHGSTFTGIKDTLINYGYPLIERFPLMFFASATVLLIGMVRWYVGTAARRAAPPEDADPTVEAADDAAASTAQASSGLRKRRSSRTTARASAATASAAAAASAIEDEAPRTSRRTSRTAATASERSTGAASGTGSRRSRHSRPPESENVEPAQSRPRRRSTPPVDPPAEPRRRPRSGEPRERRPLPPRDRRSSTHDRSERERYDRPQRRERPEPSERAERPDRAERPQRRPHSADYEPYDPPSTRRPNGSNGTHHPVSRVRYRGSDEGESRTEHRSTPRRPRHSAPDSWEYDV
ncbi:DUF6542 domain-containing protein [Mycolicibacterium hodleri]|uniref:DUF6542 domain-containing protein n=1 Tax=Mycolicibacterium hodleri TaxID=49897 RepID=A0A502EHF2_9MYCO|nr:DUF6542 domain-containing protein [Mycolicibacterium hodleri]TPG35926.1 hypothetical protein EAH80_07820 [Mycolicibacterium hodleri]